MNKCPASWPAGCPSPLSPSITSPGLCPDWEAWDPNQPVENAREAMQQADDWLGVPQVPAQMGRRGTGGRGRGWFSKFT